MADERAAPAAVALSGNEQIAAGVPRDHPGFALAATPETFAEVVNMLASGMYPVPAIAKQYGVTRAAVYMFRTRHKREIDARRAELGDRFAEITGLWIASKEERIQALQDAAERIERLLSATDEAEADTSYVAELTRTLAGIMHEVAEQLGQLPTRVQVQTTTVINYEVVGVDMSAIT